MPEEYAISSASCGLEKIDINRSFKRPINIAVYGHPYYEVCVRKVLKIIQRLTFQTKIKPKKWYKIHVDSYFQTSKYRLEVSIAEFEEPDPFASLEERENELPNKDRHPEESQTSYKDYEEAVSYSDSYSLSMGNKKTIFSSS